MRPAMRPASGKQRVGTTRLAFALGCGSGPKTKRSGIILMHGVQSHTAEELPMLLSELKSHGDSVVHVVFAKAREVATPAQYAERNFHIAGGLAPADSKRDRFWPMRCLLTDRINAQRMIRSLRLASCLP
jgi:hypothetical protein